MLSAVTDSTAGLDEVASALEAAAVEISAAYLARLHAPDRTRDAGDGMDRALRRHAFATVRSAIAGLGEGSSLPDALPGETVHLLRRWARRRLPLSAVLTGYRHVHELLWQRAFEHVVAHVPSPQDRKVLVEGAAAYLFQWVDRMSELATAAHEQAADTSGGAREHARARRVREILDGDDDDRGALGYDLRMEHVAIAARGRSAEAAVRELATRLGRRPLLVPAHDGVLWAWLGEFAPTGDATDRVLRRLPDVPGVCLAVGDALRGADGFRLSHRQACEALQLACSRGGVVLYDDVALELLASRDEPSARRFVQRELGALAISGKRSGLLRTTLEAYFGSAQNGAAAAARLGVHEQTVSYRLRSIEERLGRPVTSRRAELETALRLCALFEAAAADA